MYFVCTRSSEFARSPSKRSPDQAQTVLYRVSGWVDYRRYCSTALLRAGRSTKRGHRCQNFCISPAEPLLSDWKSTCFTRPSHATYQGRGLGRLSPRIYQSNLIGGVWRPLRGVLILGIWDQFASITTRGRSLPTCARSRDGGDLYGRLKLFLDTTVRPRSAGSTSSSDNQDGSMPVSVPIRVVAAIPWPALFMAAASLWL